MKVSLAESPLFGRESELQELMIILDSAAKGKGKSVFISGEAGSGKTRLTREFLNSARTKGVKVLASSCLSNTAIPYFPFIEAFHAYYARNSSKTGFQNNQQFETQIAQTENHLLEAEEESDVNAWLIGAKQSIEADKKQLSPQARKNLTFAAVAKVLLSISARAPTILVLEDLHWADSASLSLLHYIARAITTERVLLLVTHRSEDLSADAEGHPHPLTEILRLMRREDLLTEIKLANLDQTNVSKIAENMIGGTLHPEFSAKLAAESQGNPLFIVESLRMLSERGNLFLENDLWRLSVDTLGIPEKLKDIVLRRLSVLKFSQRRVLDAAAVIGEKFDAEQLATVLGQDSLEVLETLNMIAQSTSLIREEEVFFRFDHAKSREAIYDEIPAPLKRGYHARIAEKLESTVDSNLLSLSTIAYHYAQAGKKAKAVEYSFAAGQEALTRFSNHEAIEHFSYILNTITAGPGYFLERNRALEGLGDAYYAYCMYEEAIETFERLASLETGKSKLRALRKTMDALFFKQRYGSPERLMQLVKKAEEFAGFDRLENARIRLHRGRALALPRDSENAKRALQDTKTALAVFQEEYSLQDVALALIGIGATSISIGDLQAVGASQLSIALLEELNDFHTLADATLFAGYSFMVFGLFKEAQDMMTKTIQIGEKIGDHARTADAYMRLGLLLENSGFLEEGLSKTLKALEHAKKLDLAWIFGNIYQNLVRQFTKLGNISNAKEYFEKFMQLPPEIRSAQVQFGRLVVSTVLAHAVFFAGINQWEQAHIYFEKAIEKAKTQTHILSRVNLRRDFAWALQKQGKSEEAAVQLEEIRQIIDDAEAMFAHVSFYANLMAMKEVVVGEEFEMRLDLVNVSRKPGLLIKAEGLIPSNFEVTTLPVNCSEDNQTIKMNQRRIDQFRVETVKLRLKASKPGTFILNPEVTYIDEMNQPQICKANSITIIAQPAKPRFEALPGRISTGSEKLDALLYGGIPENIAVALTSPSTDERELLIERFLEAGATRGETTFHITAGTGNTEALAKKYSSNFFFFVCNPQADSMVQDQLNVFKLKGVENLTDIDIALNKVFRTFNLSATGPKRICIDIISDVLLQHRAINTRRWLSALLPTLKSKGFTVLVVIDRGMHPAEETQAVLGLFDGEISIFEKETPKGAARFLKIRKMAGQKYLKDEIRLAEE